jgi:hypothetical protein
MERDLYLAGKEGELILGRESTGHLPTSELHPEKPYPVVRAGALLPNGALCIACKPRSNGEEFVVLAYWRDEYVCWVASKEGDCVWGHYSESFEEAVPGYLTRR